MIYVVGSARSMNPTCSVLRERTKQATFSPIAGTAGIKIADLKRSATTIRYLRCRHARLVLYCIFGLEAVLTVAASQLEGTVARDKNGRAACRERGCQEVEN